MMRSVQVVKLRKRCVYRVFGFWFIRLTAESVRRHISWETKVYGCRRPLNLPCNIDQLLTKSTRVDPRDASKYVLQNC